MPAYWQDNIHLDSTWQNIDNIPNDKLWEIHVERKRKLIRLIKENLMKRFENSTIGYDKVMDMVNALNPEALTIGFARRFATYKRATLIFKDIARLTQILSDSKRPVQIIFAGKAHPADKEGQDLIKYIHEMSLMPQFKGKIFILENYNIGIARYLVSGVDVWLNNPRRPMEASGTSGEKASVNGVLNCSILDGWWTEGYTGNNGWAIGTNASYNSYEEQDKADSRSFYHILEDKIIPAYYNRNEKGISDDWVKLMKNSIKTTGGRYSTSRMLVDYIEQLYMPLCNLNREHFQDLQKVADFEEWKKVAKMNWSQISISQDKNVDNAKFDAGSDITVRCQVKLPNIAEENVETQVYFGQIQENGTVKNMFTQSMRKVDEDVDNHSYTYETTIKLTTGGNFGYTFRVVPKHEMLLDQENLNLVKWFEK